MFKMQSKKFGNCLGTFVLGAALIVPLTLSARSVEAQRVTINGKSLKDAIEPIKRAGRTLVGMRSIFEGLGANVQWNAKDKSITAKSGDTTVMMKIGSKIAVVDGQPVQLEQAPTLYKGNTMVPLRFVSESLGAGVNYNAQTRSIAIATDGSVDATGGMGRGSVAAGKVQLTPDKSVYVPREPIRVSFTAPLGMKTTSWVGIIPSDMPRGGEDIMDANDIGYKYLSGKTQGVLEFTAPTKVGKYDLRASDKTNEVGFAQFEVAATTPSRTPTLSLDKTSYDKGETINVQFTAFPFYPSNSWIGIVAADIPHGKEELNDANDVGYKYISGKTQGTLELKAPRTAGTYDIRMHDKSGNEVATTQAFTVN